MVTLQYYQISKNLFKYRVHVDKIDGWPIFKSVAVIDLMSDNQVSDPVIYTGAICR